MEEAAKKLDMKIACEIFADRNYEDDGNLVSRKKPHALITDPEKAKKHVLKMVKTNHLIVTVVSRYLAKLTLFVYMEII